MAPGRDVAILDDDLRVIEEGDERIGRLGRTGNIPLGYYNDPEKTAETFVTAADGKRYAIAGDFGKWAGGNIVMLGRGTMSINSGGEKIFPEEVEQALKSHPAVFDCLVVGVPDERWGQKVAAVVQWRDGQSAELAELDAHARTHVAGYKVPRELHAVERIQRSPSGVSSRTESARTSRRFDSNTGSSPCRPRASSNRSWFFRLIRAKRSFR